MKFSKKTHRGASLTEYAALLGLISVIALYTTYELGFRIKSIFEDVTTEIADSTTQDHDPLDVFEGTPTEVTDGTVVDPEIPVGTGEGDMMLAFVTHRSALNAPSGWEEITQAVVPPTSTTNQWMTVLGKRNESSDGSTVQISQAEPGRLIAHIITVDGEDSRIAYHATKTGSLGYASTPNYYTMQDNTLILAGRSAIYSTSNTPSTVEPPEGWVLSSELTKPDNRQSVAYTTEPEADVIKPSVSFIHDDGVGITPWATVLLQVRRAETDTPDPDGPIDTPTDNPLDDTYDFPRDPTGGGGAGGTDVIVRGPGGGIIVVYCPSEQWTWDEERYGYEISGVVSSHDYMYFDHEDAIGTRDGRATGFVSLPVNHATDLYETYQGKTLVVWGRYGFTQHLEPGSLQPPPEECR